MIRQVKIRKAIMTAVSITVGDCVLVKVLAFTSPHYKADKYEDSVYKVIRQPNPSIPVYVVKRS